jgi:DNA-directed RNA polymerase
MGYLRKLASAMNKKGKHMQWTTPSGWVVLQQYFPMEKNRVKCTVMGELVKLDLAIPDLDNLEARRSGQGLAPNFVHSMDAAALIGMVNLCHEQDAPINQFAVVHDSFGTLAPDMDMLSACVRHSFVHMYEWHDVLQELRDVVVHEIGARAAKSLPQVPDRGTLDLNGVMKSDFFFA